MTISIAIDGAAEISEGVWEFCMTPAEVRQLGGDAASGGYASVLLIDQAQFDRAQDRLLVPTNGLKAISIGSTIKTFAIDRRGPSEGLDARGRAPQAINNELSGDREFRALVDELLNGEINAAAHALLDGIREKSPGELKRGQSRNFSNTPDNFWYVIVQPRVQELSITIRGRVDHFTGLTELPVKDDRGNTRFKVQSLADVPSALALIFHAKRKPRP